MQSIIAHLILTVIVFTSILPLRINCGDVSSFNWVPVKKFPLKKHDRSRLAEARIQEKKSVTVLLACKSEALQQVKAEIDTYNGSVQYAAADVDYIRAEVPTERVEELAASPNVDVLNLDGYPDYYSSDVLDGLSDSRSEPEDGPPPGANTPAENPYLPTQDIGAPQFIRDHPTYDGRGATIAVVEDFPDWLSPENQTAKTIDGRTVPKLAHVYDATDSADEDLYRVSMNTEVKAISQFFVVNNVQYQAPADGNYRFGKFDASPRTATELMFPFRYFSYFPQINLVSKGKGFIFPVLWDETTGIVRVDTDQNGDFSNDLPLGDFNVNGDLGVFGRDNPETPVRDTVAFAVLINKENHSITLGIGTNSHTTGIISGAAGKSFFGGAMNGAAPEARIVVVRANLLKNYSPMEGMILAARDPQVDVLTMSWGLVKRLNDGNAVLDIVFDRLIDKYKKPMFIGASNGGPAMNTAFNATSKAIIVGGSTTRQTWQANYGFVTDRDEDVNDTASRGPSENGALKPDIIAPYDALLSAAGNTPGLASGRYYKLPAGYQQVSGTSFSGPFAAGGAALLISGAKQENLPFDAERISHAVRTSARFLERTAAHDQGAGVMNVRGAWKSLSLRKMPPVIESRGSVKTILSKYLKASDTGPGIYEREGWSPGQAGVRNITFTRRGGPNGSVSYQVRLRGNDGTFSTGESISLPRGRQVSVAVRSAPKTNGVHSTLIELVPKGESYAVYQTLCTIVAADQLVPSNGFQITINGKADFLSWKSYFFYVPPDTPVFNVTMNVTFGSLKLNFFDPSGTSYWTSHPRVPGKGLVGYQNGGKWARAIPNPEPGVWEVIVINGDTSNNQARGITQSPADFTLAAGIYNVAVACQSNEQGSIKTVLQNSGAEVNGRVEWAAGVGSNENIAFRSGGKPMIREIEIPAETEDLYLSLDDASDRMSDIDLYLYDCTGLKCMVTEHSITDSALESIHIENPKPGKWKILIDPFTTPNRFVRVTYREAYVRSNSNVLSETRLSAFRNSSGKWIKQLSFANFPTNFTSGSVGIFRFRGTEINTNYYRPGESTLIRPADLSRIFMLPAFDKDGNHK